MLTAETQRKIRDVFESEMELGLAKNPPVASSLQMENTFLPELCDGSGLTLHGFIFFLMANWVILWF